MEDLEERGLLEVIVKLVAAANFLVVVEKVADVAPGRTFTEASAHSNQTADPHTRKPSGPSRASRGDKGFGRERGTGSGGPFCSLRGTAYGRRKATGSKFSCLT